MLLNNETKSTNHSKNLIKNFNNINKMKLYIEISNSAQIEIWALKYESFNYCSAFIFYKLHREKKFINLKKKNTTIKLFSMKNIYKKRLSEKRNLFWFIQYFFYISK